MQALIYWARDQKRRGIIIEAANWTPVTMADAIKHVNLDTPHKEVARPGKVQRGIKWTMWDMKRENYLVSMMGASGIPLDYIVRRYQPEGWTADNDHDRLKYQALHVGPSYKTDGMLVYGELKSCFLDSKGWAWIKRFDSKKDGRIAMLSLR